MDTVSVQTLSENGVSMSNPELIDNKKKKRKKSRKLDDPHLTSHNVEADEASLSREKLVKSALPAVSYAEPEATLHHTVPISSTTKDELPESCRKGSSRKKSRSGEKKKKKKKKDTSCEEAEITNKEDQLLPSSNGMIQEGSGEHTQKLCENPSATDMICSQKRKKKKKRDRNTLKDGDVDIHCSKAEVTTECNSISEPEGSKSMGVEENVLQTQSPKAKKRKKKRTKTVEVCEPVECREDNDLNAGRGSMSNLASKRENSASGEESSVQNLGKTKNKETDENTLVDEDVVGADVGDSKRKKHKGKKKKTSSAEHEAADLEVCDPSRSTLPATAESESKECLLDHSNREDRDNCDGNAGQEFVGEATANKSENPTARGKSEEKKKLEDTVCNQIAFGPEGVSEVEVNAKKRKKERKDSLDKKIDNMEEENGEVSIPRNDEEKRKKKERKNSLDNKTDIMEEEKGEVEVNAKKRKKKERKNSLDKKTDNMEEEKGEVSVPSNGEEPKFDRENPETSLSSSVLISNNVAQRVASPETGLQRCSCRGQSSRKLLVLDLNGILADVAQGNTGQFVPDGHVASRKIFRRPFVADFLEFCFERFDVGIWSSRRIGLDYMIKVVMKCHANNLLFCFDQHMCTETKFSSQESRSKPLFLKDLRRVWDRYGTCFSCEKRKYDETNTLLIDDSAHKSMCNPPYTGIFPESYTYTHSRDSALGPEGDLRKYLTRLADAENVQKFVKENPFGQIAITEAHGSWEYYSKVIKEHKLKYRQEC